VNWLITSRCGLSCSYCFSPKDDSNHEAIPASLDAIDGSSASRVTISGGEPMLVDGVDGIVKALKESGKEVSLHTNGYLLDEAVARRLQPYVDEVHIPIDSANRKINDSMRGLGSMEAFEKASGVLNRAGIKTGIHTVVAPQNIGKLLELRDYVSQGEFFNWKLYQEVETGIDGGGAFGDSRDGDVDHFMGEFLEAEERFGRDDPRIKFVLNTDRMPYTFLDSNGDVTYRQWFSEGGRVFGNVMNRGLDEIVEEIGAVGGFDSEEFFDAQWNLPLWARAFNGEFDMDDLKNVEDFEKFSRLMELYERHSENLTS